MTHNDFYSCTFIIIHGFSTKFKGTCILELSYTVLSFLNSHSWQLKTTYMYNVSNLRNMWYITLSHMLCIGWMKNSFGDDITKFALWLQQIWTHITQGQTWIIVFQSIIIQKCGSYLCPCHTYQYPTVSGLRKKKSTF